jgi:hypothetical protein
MAWGAASGLTSGIKNLKLSPICSASLEVLLWDQTSFLCSDSHQFFPVNDGYAYCPAGNDPSWLMAIMSIPHSSYGCILLLKIEQRSNEECQNDDLGKND